MKRVFNVNPTVKQRVTDQTRILKIGQKVSPDRTTCIGKRDVPASDRDPLDFIKRYGISSPVIELCRAAIGMSGHLLSF